MSVNHKNSASDLLLGKAMVLAAGLGTRLGEITRDLPKALVPLHGMPLLEIVIRRLIQEGWKELIVNTHAHANQVQGFLNQHHNFGISITLSHEKEIPLETGGAIRHARSLLTNAEGFLVHNADVLTDLPLRDFYCQAMQEGSLAALSVRQRKASRYLLGDSRMILCGWEDPQHGIRKVVRDPYGTLSRYGFSGIHLLKKRILDLLPPKKVFSLTDLYLDLARQQEIKLLPYQEGFWYDIGKPETLKKAATEITDDILRSLTGISAAES